MQLNEISMLLLQKLKEDSQHTGQELLTSIAAEINHPQADVVLEGGRVLMEELRNKQIILGTHP
jgi:hypothetical protein